MHRSVLDNFQMICRMPEKINLYHRNLLNLVMRQIFLAHETAQTHRKSIPRSFDLGRRSSTGYSCAPSKSKHSNAALIIGIVTITSQHERYFSRDVKAASCRHSRSIA